MERYGRLKIMIGVDPRYCAECGAPDLDDGCTNPACWRARANARLPLTLAFQQTAIQKCFSLKSTGTGFMHRYLHPMRWSIFSPAGMHAKHAEKPA